MLIPPDLLVLLFKALISILESKKTMPNLVTLQNLILETDCLSLYINI